MSTNDSTEQREIEINIHTRISQYRWRIFVIRYLNSELDEIVSVPVPNYRIFVELCRRWNERPKSVAGQRVRGHHRSCSTVKYSEAVLLAPVEIAVHFGDLCLTSGSRSTRISKYRTRLRDRRACGARLAVVPSINRQRATESTHILTDSRIIRLVSPSISSARNEIRSSPRSRL